MMDVRCPICGAPLKGTICEYCGTPVRNGRGHNTSSRPERQSHSFSQEKTVWVQTSTKSKWIAFLLCLFLGWLGAHRFYVGKFGTGVLYVATRGFYGVGIVIDLLLILSGHFTDGDGLPLQELKV